MSNEQFTVISIGQYARVITNPITASQNPLTLDERLMIAMNDRIKELEQHVANLKILQMYSGGRFDD